MKPWLADNPLAISPETARRLAIAKQHLSGRPPRNPGAGAIMDVMRDIRYLQLDPTGAVAPSHLLVLWSRLGPFRGSDLDRLLWTERRLFEYWCHQASIVLTEDYPLYSPLMREWPEGMWMSNNWRAKVKEWDSKNQKLRTRLLEALRSKGPMLSRKFEKPRRKKRSSGWGAGSNETRMLAHLFFRGEVMVAGRQGRQKV